MKLRLLTVSQKVPAWVQAGFEDYARRLPREAPLELVEVRPARREVKAPAPAQLGRLRAMEAERLRAARAPGARLVGLDERGRMVRTLELAALLEGWQAEGRDVDFLVGGADGLDEALKAECGPLLSLSALTLPHALVRVIVAEQIYRAVSVLRNHPYHRE